MRILFYSTWGFDEGITQSTVIPIVKKLATFEKVEKIILATTEKRKMSTPFYDEKIVLEPVASSGASAISKLYDLAVNPFRLLKLIKKYRIDLLWCRGAPAGGTGALVKLISGQKFVVDSFEPHSEYMSASKTWKKFGFKYTLQLFLEFLCTRNAVLLLPVSGKFKDKLIKKNIRAEKIQVFPCIVDVRAFSFNLAERQKIRAELKVHDNTVVGIYVGKFGGLYYDLEAFQFYKKAFDYWHDRFFLIILSEMDSDLIISKCIQFGIDPAKISVRKASHKDIPGFLSAADIAFSTIKSVPAMQYCSPIKHGEYWASGLPILSTLAYGDDADIIRNEKGGFVIDVNDSTETLSKVFAVFDGFPLQRRAEIAELANIYRNPELMDEAIQFVLENAGYKSLI